MLAALLAALGPAHAQMYKCVDERGVTHYSDKPRPGCKGGEVDIRPIPSVSGKVTERREDLAGRDADFKRRQSEQARAEAKDKAVLDRRCAQLRREYGWLSGGTRISKLNAKGEREYMDDATRDQRLAQMREHLRGCP